jgi:hypothetical protein
VDPETDFCLFVGDPGTLMVLRGPIVTFKPQAVGKPHVIVFSGSSYGGGSVHVGLNGFDMPPDAELKVPAGNFNVPLIVTPTTAETVGVHMYAGGTHQIGINRVEVSVIAN